MELDFQKILNHFIGELVFKALTETTWISPDEVVYTLETNQGTYYIVQTDNVSSFAHIVLLIKNRTESFAHFVEPKFPIFYPTKYYFGELDNYTDFDDYKKYKQYVCLIKGLAFGPGLTFLIKK